MPQAFPRPYHLITVFWGKRFRDYFLNYALASLLAPGNLPSLDAPGSKLLIATRPDDWAAIRETPIMRKAARYIEPVFVKIPSCPPGVHGCAHMGVGHKLACEIAYRDKAFAGIIAPDSIFSDGTIAALQGHAAAGKKLVYVPACLRIAEEPFLAKLRAMEIVAQRPARDTGEPIVATGRQITRAMIGSLHSASLPYDWDAWHVLASRGIPVIWWRVPGEDGLLLHCLSWAALLIDYAAFGRHDTSCIEDWTIDGDYAFKNLGMTGDIHIVRDSDEISYAGFTPTAEQPVDLLIRSVTGPRAEVEKLRCEAFRESLESGLFDPIKLAAFREPVMLHSRDLTPRWDAVKARAAGILGRNIFTSKAEAA